MDLPAIQAYYSGIKAVCNGEYMLLIWVFAYFLLYAIHTHQAQRPSPADASVDQICNTHNIN